MPKVSICIPAYNQIMFLKHALQSILNQTYLDYEVVITDDSDNDDVKTLVQSLDFQGRLYYYKNERAMGSPRNWNQSISKATGEYIKILHHDDWFNSNDSLSKLVALLDNSDSSFAFCGCNNVTADGDNLYYHAITEKEVSIIRACPEFLFFNNRIGAPSVTIFKRSGIVFDEKIKYFVDIEFYIRLLKHDPRFTYTTEALVNVGIGPGQVTNIFKSNKELLLFEYSYTFHRLSVTLKNFRWCYVGFWNLFELLNIQSVEELKRNKWDGEIPAFILKIIAARQFLKKTNKERFNRVAKYLTYIPAIFTMPKSKR